MPDRFALYYAPPTEHPLWIRAAQWMGRNPAGGPVDSTSIGGLTLADRLPITASARRYGFHATLKAPMGLAPGATLQQLESAIEAFASVHPRPRIGRLVVAPLDGFLALIPAKQSDALTAFAADLVAAFEPFRAPLSTRERARRVAGGELTARQVELLDRYGYPYVEEEFRFHMTLTDRLTDADRSRVEAILGAWLAPVLEQSYELDRIVLFHETEPGAPFRRLNDFPLRAEIAADV